MEQSLVYIGIAIVGLLLVLFGIATVLARFYRQVQQGQVLIVNTMKSEPTVSFTGAVVIPIINRAETMDISLKTIEIDRRGKQGLICADNIRADIKVSFFVRVNKTVEDVLKVAGAVGCQRASDLSTLQELFEAKFSEGLKTVGKRLNFEDLYKEREVFKDQIVSVIGKDLNGYMLEDAAIDYLEQTPVEMLDKENILDAQGIRKITELTTIQNVLTNEFRQDERKKITKQNVESDEAVFALERQRAEAAAKQKREIETIQARENAETQRVQQEEHLKAELARVRAEEELQINEQNKQRQVQVAEKNRERVVGIETERVAKDRALEAISREREVELQRIGKEKALEGERKAIADVISTRIAVEKKVAGEEENIKQLRLVAEAQRKKEAAIINAEALAQQASVERVKAAEASEEVAKHEARQRLIAAEASLEAADKEARAKIRLAEGLQAESAAEGLAQARVLEAQALAEEKQGLAQVRVKEAEATATEKRGQADANVLRQRLLAEAEGDQQKGLAQARVLEAQAEATQKQGLAEAEATRARVQAEALGVQEKLLAESKGLTEKAKAMSQLQGATKDHEEFRMRLDKERAVEMEALHVRKDVALSSAQVLSTALQNAKINIVGGDGQFFDQFVKATSLSHAVEQGATGTETMQTLLKPYLTGERQLPEDLKAILSRPGITQDAQNLAAAAALTKLAKNDK
ncbi:MAG: hypothetical protein DI536_05280 [Archangium gephyra]|uniref:Membrane protein YqiK n=1 Tax=Archangium gephyra TaxID=48 RepID=A0A2W5TLW2_9BACT|nr:MAG: hypothetical protein DI536_05280 [Archangium gephyra]